MYLRVGLRGLLDMFGVGCMGVRREGEEAQGGYKCFDLRNQNSVFPLTRMGQVKVKQVCRLLGVCF